VDAIETFVGAGGELQLAVFRGDASHRERREDEALLLVAGFDIAGVDVGVDDEDVAFVDASGNVPDLIERIETAERVADHEKEARRFTDIGREHQVHGARDIGLDAVRFAIFIFAAGAGDFEQRLAGIDGEILCFASGELEGFQNFAVAQTFACAEADDGDRAGKSLGETGGAGSQAFPGLAERFIGAQGKRSPRFDRERVPVEEFFREVTSLNGLDQFSGDLGFRQQNFNIHGPATSLAANENSAAFGAALPEKNEVSRRYLTALFGDVTW